MTRLLESVLKPEYVFAPAQLWRRLTRLGPPPAHAVVTLPWGLPLQVAPARHIGSALWRIGVYDLVLSEALWRLADPGEVAVDVGANVGYCTALLAARVGTGGAVHAVEAHPALVAQLRGNVARWRDVAPVTVHALAATASDGVATLVEPAGFGDNDGIAELAEPGVPGLGVPAARLDTLLDAVPRVGVLKLDVEGHEAEVLAGATKLLRAGRVRDIVLEDLARTTDSPLLRRLRDHGFEVVRLNRAWGGVVLAGLEVAPHPGFDPPSMLATRDLGRARRRFAARGWQVLRA